MTAQDDDGAGYRRPPRATRWKKGQTGNPGKKRRTRKVKSQAQMVEEALGKTVKVDGIEQPLTLLKLILKQLWIKVAAGDKRALRIWRKYEAFAKSMPDVKVQPPSRDGVNLFVESLKA